MSDLSNVASLVTAISSALLFQRWSVHSSETNSECELARKDASEKNAQSDLTENANKVTVATNTTTASSTAAPIRTHSPRIRRTSAPTSPRTRTATTKFTTLKNTATQTGLCYDECFLLHELKVTEGKKPHVENPGRVKSIMALLQSEGIVEKCTMVPCREATLDEILLVHIDEVIEAVEKTKTITDSVHLGNDIFANQYTSKCASTAAGCLINLSIEVMEDRLANGFAVIRPPGHHAGKTFSMGFCVYNNIAIAARAVQAKYGPIRIAIIDWDVHHGNGTEDVFYDDPTVLYMSVHKYGNSFYPGTGEESDCGVRQGEGFNVNAPFYSKKMGDGDYMELFKKLFVPILHQFEPELILVSAGFDCGENDKLGPMCVSTEGFSQMMSLLKESMGHGRIVCALEGGYTYETTSNGVLACVNVLLEEPPLQPAITAPSIDGSRDIERAINVQRKYWSILEERK